MKTSIPTRVAALLSATALAAVAVPAQAQEAPAAPPAGAASAGEAAPKIDVTKSPTIQKYQLKRLTNPQLQAVERKPEKPYKTVYEAVLTRKGLDRKFREESVAALATINGTDPAVELLSAIGLVPTDDKGTARELVGLLVAQKPAALAAQKEKLQGLVDAENPTVRQAAYAALAIGGNDPEAAWTLAAGKEGGTAALMAALPLVPDAKVRQAFYDKVSPLVAKGKDEAEQVAAIEAVSAVAAGHEADVFKTLADIIQSDKGAKREAAIRSLRRVPADKFPKDQVEPVARAVITYIKELPVDKRSEAEGVSAVQLGNELASALTGAQGNAVRKELRAVAVQVVAVGTYVEQMLYDVRYFVVQGGKPVKVVLENPDFMPHNIVFTAPGAMEKVAQQAGTMAPPTDEKVKPFVPNTKEVLAASHLANGGETVSVSFTAPNKPGEYPFVCTFPGHWVRMYGVMVVVSDIDAYDRNPKAPLDPLTKKPMPGKKHEPMGGPGTGGHAAHAH
jgi:azurin